MGAVGPGAAVCAAERIPAKRAAAAAARDRFHAKSAKYDAAKREEFFGQCRNARNDEAGHNDATCVETRRSDTRGRHRREINGGDDEADHNGGDTTCFENRRGNAGGRNRDDVKGGDDHAETGLYDTEAERREAGSEEGSRQAHGVCG